MKKRFALFLVAALTCCTTGAAMATPVELISNGTFDQGIQGWHTYGDVQVTAAGPYAASLGMDGNYALLGGQTSAGFSGLWQSFAIQGIDQVTLSFDWAFPYLDLSSSREDTFLSFVRQDGSPVMRITLQDLRSDGVNLSNHGSYHQTIDISPYTSDDALLVFRLWEDTPWTVSAVGIDNVSVRGVAPVPEPATLLLFATGLAGIAGLRRRTAGGGDETT